jgi:hypothetical protein
MSNQLLFLHIMSRHIKRSVVRYAYIVNNLHWQHTWMACICILHIYICIYLYIHTNIYIYIYIYIILILKQISTDYVVFYKEHTLTQFHKKCHKMTNMFY